MKAIFKAIHECQFANQHKTFKVVQIKGRGDIWFLDQSIGTMLRDPRLGWFRVQVFYCPFCGEELTKNK